MRQFWQLVAPVVLLVVVGLSVQPAGAAPHVAGAAALYIATHPGATWQQVRDGLVALGEALGAGHTDPSGVHSETVVRADAL